MRAILISRFVSASCQVSGMADNYRTAMDYYSRTDVQKAIIDVARDREIVAVYSDGRFGKRPDILQYGEDILQSVRSNAVSFHGSVERWKQPMALDAGMTKAQLDNNRAGWDILIDIDVPDFEIAKTTATELINALREHGISSSSISLKFTGGKSFHMGVPFEALPTKIDMRPTVLQYPSAMEKIQQYLKSYTTEALRDALLRVAAPSELAESVGKKMQDIISEEGIEPYKIVNMDIFGSRHMFRLPYSLHEKSMYVSLPIDPAAIQRFKKEDAHPDKFKKVELVFLDRGVGSEEARLLVIQAFDWAAKNMKEKEEKLPTGRQRKGPLRRISEDNFPPCIKSVFNGVADGRKRSVFVLINFLQNMGWGPEEIEKRLNEWNEKNYPPLRANYIRSQLRWHIQQSRDLLPPNCDNDQFYCQYNVCKPDMICVEGSRVEPQDIQPCGHGITIKNPVNYAFRKLRREGKLGNDKKRPARKPRSKRPNRQ